MIRISRGFSNRHEVIHASILWGTTKGNENKGKEQEFIKGKRSIHQINLTAESF